MLSELERLAREATQGAVRMTRTPLYLMRGQADEGNNRHEPTVSVVFDSHTEQVATFWNYLLPAKANAEYYAALVNAAPLLLAAVRAAEEVERWSQVHGVEAVKDVAMDALRDALAALKGKT